MNNVETTVELLVSENKSDRVEWFRNNLVRVFVNRDYSYGVWVDEQFLFDLLNQNQQKQYLEGKTYEDQHFQIARELADKIQEKRFKF